MDHLKTTDKKSLQGAERLKKRKKDQGASFSPQSLVKYSNFSEFRRIQNKILNHHIFKDFKIFMFTSPHLDCGTSIVLSNVAFSLSREIDVRILVADFNSRDLSQHRIFNASITSNVTEKFLRSAGSGELVVPTCIPNIDLFSLLSVPDYAPGQYSYDLIIDFLYNARKNYDFVLLDMPPVDAKNRKETDTPSISRLVDAVILVTRLRVTRVEQLKEAKKELEEFDANIIGVIVNRYRR